MCILIYKPKDAALPVEAIKNAFKVNSDGAGFITPVTKKEFFFAKGFMTEKHLLRALKEFKHAELSIHLRMATHGKVSKENCHPFIVNKSKKAILHGRSTSLLMHNGVLAQYGDRENSDSWHFAREALSPLNFNARCRLLDQITGKFILAQAGDFHLFGLTKDAENGCFFSNQSYKKQLTIGSWEVSRAGRGVYTGVTQNTERFTPEPTAINSDNYFNGSDWDSSWECS
jgi:hypothetical protein